MLLPCGEREGEGKMCADNTAAGLPDLSPLAILQPLPLFLSLSLSPLSLSFFLFLYFLSVHGSCTTADALTSIQVFLRESFSSENFHFMLKLSDLQKISLIAAKGRFFGLGLKFFQLLLKKLLLIWEKAIIRLLLAIYSWKSLSSTAS